MGGGREKRRGGLGRGESWRRVDGVSGRSYWIRVGGEGLIVGKMWGEGRTGGQGTGVGRRGGKGDVQKWGR